MTVRDQFCNRNTVTETQTTMTFGTNECIQISKLGVWWSPFLASVGLLNICKVQNVAAHCSGQGNESSVIPRHRSFSSPSSVPGNEATMCSFSWEFFSFFATQFLMFALLQLSLIPRPFSLPSFWCLQYATMEGDGLRAFII